ncbi:DgyrCDS10199 [Dimorphilus gyrociliatus]|uniref:DgyrCDS10199 n=1 Tax=Dimorphilus gyrociliatus TaxID=2664684 RepID=A0A7I8W1I0_9ANNE|nr:DgyrCDS10199 [Dimorphilus gyrociliatus]
MENSSWEKTADETNDENCKTTVLGYSRSLTTLPNTDRQYRFFDDALFRDVLTVDDISVKLIQIPEKVLNLRPGSATFLEDSNSSTIYENDLKRSLFFALQNVPLRENDNFVALDIPPLEDKRFVGFPFEFPYESSSTPDAGFHSQDDEEFETLLPQVTKTMKPFLSESEPDDIICSYKRYLSMLRYLNKKSSIYSPDILTDVETLTFALQHSLLGLPSALVDMENNQLTLKEGVRVKSFSQEAILSLAQEFLDHGNLYLDLQYWDPTNIMQKTLQNGVQRFLKRYSKFILSLTCKRPIELLATVKNETASLRFIHDLCGTREFSGRGLVNDIYNKSLRCSSIDEEIICQHLLKATSSPFTKALYKWIENGISDDLFVYVNHSFSSESNRSYWLKAYEPVEIFPIIDKETYKMALICGKSINLLRRLQPDHPFLQISSGPSSLPRLFLTFDYYSLNKIEYHLNVYESNVRAILAADKMKREAIFRKKRISKRDLVVRARKTALERTKAFEENKRKRLLKIAEDKKILLQNFKEQMDNEVARKQEMKKLEKERDLQILEESRQLEEEQLKASKEEMENQYSKLYAQAERRERRAIWRLQRLKLHDQRIKLHFEEDELYKTILKELGVKKEAAPIDLKNFEAAKIPVAFRDTVSSLINAEPVKVYPAPSSSEKVTSQSQDEVLEKMAFKPKKILPHDTAGDIIYNEIQEIEEFKRTTKAVDGQHPNKESEVSEKSIESSVRSIPNSHVSQESKNTEEEKKTVKSVAGHHMTMESQTPEESSLPCRKIVAGRNIHEESSEVSSKSTIKISNMKSTTESKPEVVKPPRKSFFGHVSDLSKADYTYDIPKLKRPVNLNAIKETVSMDRFIPKRKTVSSHSVGDQTKETETRHHIKLYADKHASIESELIDTDARRLEVFKLKNRRGHSSNSTIQNLLYFDKKTKTDERKQTRTIKTEEEIIFEYGIWNSLDRIKWESPLYRCQQYMPPELYIPGQPNNREDSDNSENEIFSENNLVVSVTSAVSRCLATPILLQKSLIDNALLSYFIYELEFDKHIKTVRDFVLFCDGAFAHQLAHQLASSMDDYDNYKGVGSILHPYFLKEIRNKSLTAAVSKRTSVASEFVDFLVTEEEDINDKGSNVVKRLSLSYNATWPLNIIFSADLMQKCSILSNFLLQLRYVVIIGHSVWLKCTDLRMREGANEMCHWTRVLLDYVSMQVHSAAWKLWRTKRNAVKNLDNLHDSLSSYVKSCLRRCLLNEKARPVQAIIQKMLSVLCDVYNLLDKENSDGEILKCMQLFHGHAVFLFKVIKQLSVRGYQTHLNELLLRLNFNEFYKSKGK